MKTARTFTVLETIRNPRELIREIETSIAPLAKRYGVNIEFGPGHSSTIATTIRLRITPAGQTGERLIEAEFRRLAPLVDADPNWYGKIIRLSGTRYRITSIKTCSPKFCIQVARCDDGKIFKVPLVTVRAGLEAAA